MCGISGIIETNKVVQIDKKYHIEQINKTMHHRGPDSNGCWVDNKNIDHFSIQLRPPLEVRESYILRFNELII